jgi:predicted ArsR family transcriptional regulator
VADTLGLHPNTVRPHLERMRDVGLLVVETEVRSGVGRPQHLYSLAEDAPSLGLEPPSHVRLSRMLAATCAVSGAGSEEALVAGYQQGERDAEAYLQSPSCLEAIVGELDRLGFDPAVSEADDTGDRAVVAFAHCPYRELAEAFPNLVCSLHRGMVEGFAARLGGEIDDFHPLAHREPCQMTISSR